RFRLRQEFARAGLDAARRAGMGLSDLSRAAAPRRPLSHDQSACDFSVTDADRTNRERPADPKHLVAMTESPRVCLCVPTFRRPEGLRKLLADVERLNYAGPLDVIVVDNDAEGSEGAAVVEAVARTFRFPLACIVEPRRGQTYAYNCAFAHACRATPAPDYVAVLDDDEYPDPNWLTEMIRVARAYGVDIVGGPGFPVFDNPDHWLAKSGFHAPSRNATGPVTMIYGAGNMLIRRSVLEAYLNEPFA